MHIPDGFLTNRIAFSLDALSFSGILFAARRAKIDLSGRIVPLMGVLASFVFGAQMLNFPILGGTSGHLIGGSLLAILLGPMAGFLTMATVIIAQALFMQDGGLIALGANIFNMGAITTFSGYAIFRILKGNAGNGKRLMIAAFLAAWISLLISAACCAVEIGLSGAIPLRIGLTAMMGYHAIVGIIEGLLTAGVLSFLLKVRPDLLGNNNSAKFGAANWIGAFIFVAIPAAILALAGSSVLPDPLEKLLAASPSGYKELGPESLFSANRYVDYLIRGAIFIALIGIAFLAAFFNRRRHQRS
jgi:cobalt/nickel transport system permease protein